MWTLTAALLSVVPFYYNAIFNVPLIITPKDQYVSTKISHLHIPLVIYLLLQTGTIYFIAIFMIYHNIQKLQRALKKQKLSQKNILYEIMSNNSNK